MRWSPIDFEKMTMTVKVKAVKGPVGRVKAEYSEDELPLDPEFRRCSKEAAERRLREAPALIHQ